MDCIAPDRAHSAPRQDPPSCWGTVGRLFFNSVLSVSRLAAETGTKWSTAAALPLLRVFHSQGTAFSASRFSFTSQRMLGGDMRQ
jgi:hypothetical protein